MQHYTLEQMRYTGTYKTILLVLNFEIHVSKTIDSCPSARALAQTPLKIPGAEQNCRGIELGQAYIIQSRKLS